MTTMDIRSVKPSEVARGHFSAGNRVRIGVPDESSESANGV